jgi:hypothetical protein
VTLRFGRGVPVGDVVFRTRVSEVTADDKAKLLQAAVPALKQLLEAGVQVNVEDFAKIFGIPLRENNAP